jgi:hypothetical protein
MTDPRRNDVFEDANGLRVAVKQLYAPNALGVSFVEYKNLSDSNLRFLTKEQFLEIFHWVDNFGSTDTFVKVVLEKEAKSLEATAAAKVAKAAQPAEESDSTAEKTEADAADESADDGIRSAAPTRSS